jgi:hypothetical protein
MYMFFGLALVIIGFLFLLQNLGLISGDFWSILWPCLVILLGVSLIFRRERESKWKRFRDKINKSFKSEDK